jgi:hypothetical protein
MELSASWEAASRSAIQEFRKIYGSRKVITVFTRPSTGPYPEPDGSSQYNSILSLLDPF